MSENQRPSSSNPERRPPPAPPRPEAAEDAGSQALAEALRSSFAIVKIIMIVLVVIFLGSGFFTVSSQERALILRFGKPIATGEQQLLGPGAHWAFPYPIDEVVKIPYSQFQTATSTTGWYATTPEASNSEPAAGSTLNPAADGYTLTADGNIIHIRATMRYRINDPIRYALSFVNASNLIQNALNNALFHASAQFNVDEALRFRLTELKEKITARVRQLVDQHQLGITIEQVEMQSKAPRYVNPSFEAVLTAEQERRQTNEVAQAYASQVRSMALGQSNVVVNAGETDRTRAIQSIAADARYFTNQLPHYRSNPQLFVSRVRVESLHRILTNTSVKKWFMPERAHGKPTELRIQLSPEQQTPAKPQTTP